MQLATLLYKFLCLHLQHCPYSTYLGSELEILGYAYPYLHKATPFFPEWLLQSPLLAAASECSYCSTSLATFDLNRFLNIC